MVRLSLKIDIEQELKETLTDRTNSKGRIRNHSPLVSENGSISQYMKNVNFNVNMHPNRKIQRKLKQIPEVMKSNGSLN